MAERKQVSAFVSAETMVLIERLKKEQDCTTGKLIELVIAVYATSERTSLGTSVDTSESLVQILEWRDEVNNRLLTLESRVEGLAAAGKGMDAPADKMPVVADLPPSVVADDAGAEKKMGKAGKRQAVSDEEFDALVKRLAAKEGGGFLGIRLTVAALREAGYQATQDRVSASLERLKVS